jgi:transposase
MDNLRAQEVTGVRQAIEAAGAGLRYLPQDSPDLNPIPMPFAKLKRLLRKAVVRTVRPFAVASARSCRTSVQKNAQTTLLMMDMLHYERNLLSQETPVTNVPVTPAPLRNWHWR